MLESSEDLHTPVVIASNEELQSTNEELHSVNEELYTVNAEYQRRVDELAQANDDMDNLLASTRVGVIFLDTDLCIRRFTPEISRLFHLMSQSYLDTASAR
ncbi:MAG: PAS domain-containing protein [Planctomycetaceae bacterium]|nr:PAS domain-containing protein [Planctomycetaceae bacterium]